MEACFFVEESPEPISGADEQTVYQGKEVFSTFLNSWHSTSHTLQTWSISRLPTELNQ